MKKAIFVKYKFSIYNIYDLKVFVNNIASALISHKFEQESPFYCRFHKAFVKKNFMKQQLVFNTNLQNSFQEYYNRSFSDLKFSCREMGGQLHIGQNFKENFLLLLFL